MKNKSIKNYLKFIVKFLLTVAALFFVFKKIEIEKFIMTVKNANLFFLFLAIIAFNVSKLISAFRLNNFFRAVDLRLKNSFNLRLYWVGMFYNLFLPGSIGGDGYKVYLLNQLSPSKKLKSLITATFLDRTSGMVFLLFIAIVLILFSSFAAPIPFFNFLMIGALLLLIPVYYLVLKLFFNPFTPIFFQTNYQAFLVQAGQVLCAYLLLLSLHVNSHYMDYLSLFMMASVVSVLPLTIGGVGLREVVVYASLPYLKIEEATSVAFTISFFMVTAFTSFVGLLFLPGIDKEAEGGVFIKTSTKTNKKESQSSLTSS